MNVLIKVAAAVHQVGTGAFHKEGVLAPKRNELKTVLLFGGRVKQLVQLLPPCCPILVKNEKIADPRLSLHRLHVLQSAGIEVGDSIKIESFDCFILNQESTPEITFWKLKNDS